MRISAAEKMKKKGLTSYGEKSTLTQSEVGKSERVKYKTMLLTGSKAHKTTRSHNVGSKTIRPAALAFSPQPSIRERVLIRSSLSVPPFSGLAFGFSSHGSEVCKKMDILPSSHV